jgi:hypothetical protein
MKSPIKAVLTTSALLLATTQAVSAHNLGAVTIEKVGYAGNGCPAGSASVVLANDKKSVSVLFDEYIAEAGGHGQRTFARKKCDIAFGLKVPNGLSVALINADYRGFTDLPRRAKATFTRDYFFAGSRGPRLKKTWKGSRSDDFTVTDNMGIMSRVYSKCGADVILRSKTAATVRTRRGQEALMSVDSADLTSRTVFRYNFSWKKC